MAKYTLKRTHYCTDLSAADIGSVVNVCGWVQRSRNLGGIIFVALRDRTGLLQLRTSEAENKEIFDLACELKGEYVIAARGTVCPREDGNVNPNMKTGEIEINLTALEILSEAETPPFEIVENSNVKEEKRLTNRYLDLRRPDLQRVMIMRHKVAAITHDYFDKNGFLEIETPILAKPTPEGARDYLVPSRVNKGSFYALPQSPQLYKQLLMVAGYDRYMQIARCFRDEDLRAHRQPEFTQIDLEMSFVDVDDVISVNEGFLKRLFKETIGVDLQLPLPRMKYAEAMDRFGSDKPDLRFGFELRDLSDIVAGCGFKVFADTVAAGGSVRAINVKGFADKLPRREIDGLAEFVKTYRAKGLAWAKLANGEMTSSFAKFLTADEMKAILERMDACDNDVIFVVADTKNKVVFDSLGALRCELAERLGLLKADDYKLLWITDFPLFEYDEEEDRLVAMHHPFTAPMDDDLELLDTDPQKVHAKAYDIVINGVEAGGGSLRIFSSEIQNKMFRAIGISEETAQLKFGYLLEAFKYGVPPHGGMAYGLDRLMMILSGRDSIRDVIAFPKVQTAAELMTGSPSGVEQAQLDELGIAIVAKDE